MIAAKLAAMADILDELKLLGMFMVTVIVGLMIHALVVLPIEVSDQLVKHNYT